MVWGNLWSEDDVINVTQGISAEKLAECRHTLFGKLYSRPNVNFLAFIKTMTWAWKTDNVSCTALEPGFFSFTFKSEAEKQRILDAVPWSFSSNLLVLQQCDPDIPDICYDFSQCPFWVHLFGLPFGRVTTEVVREIASRIGEVLEVKHTIATLVVELATMPQLARKFLMNLQDWKKTYRVILGIGCERKHGY